MKEICVNIPELEVDQTVEVEIRVKGKNQELLYRVEAFDLSKVGDASSSRVDQLRIMIQSYEMSSRSRLRNVRPNTSRRLMISVCASYRAASRKHSSVRK